MDEACFTLIQGLIAPNYARHAKQGSAPGQSAIKSLMAQRRLPEQGWDRLLIEHFLNSCALMDSNNFGARIGMDEREGRVDSDVLRQRHFGMTHGIGRSGDLTANQPKAAGSSLIYTLTNCLALDALKRCGARTTKTALVTPLCTGMTLALAMQTLAYTLTKPSGLPASAILGSPSAKDSCGGDTPGDTPGDRQPQTPITVLLPALPAVRRFVIWSRIDQKSCYKSILTAGLTPVVVELTLQDGQLVTDVSAITRCLEALQDQIMKMIDTAMQCGRVDCYIQSTDKNFFTPVGGSIIASRDEAFVRSVSAAYPGRASAGPIVDLLISLLSMGAQGLQTRLHSRQVLLEELIAEIGSFLALCGEAILPSPANEISIAISLDTLSTDQVRRLGAQLFYRGVTGPRAVPLGEVKDICNTTFA
eukprot:gene768-2529_t